MNADQKCPPERDHFETISPLAFKLNSSTSETFWPILREATHQACNVGLSGLELDELTEIASVR